MADQIVACPGCGKKFKIPDGAAPTGSFPCTACGKDVPWGKSAGPRPTGKAAPAAAPAKAKPAAAAPQVQAPVRQAPAAKGRRSRDDDDEPKGKQKGPKEEKLSGGMLAMIIGVVLLVVIIIAVNSGRNDDAPVVQKPTTPVPVAQQPATPAPATPAVAPKPATGGTPAGAGDSAGSGGNDSSGIGGTRNEAKSSYGQWYRAPDLFGTFDTVEGTTPEERAKFDEDAALFANPNAGREATVAGSRLKKAGKKAIPSILGEFAKQWNAGKWTTDAEKQSSFSLQTLLKEIVKASDPTKGFVARWSRGVEVAPSEFEKAARIWCAWWRSEGKDLTEFKPFAE